MKPGDFFIGVTEFFSILLPGAAMGFIACQVASHVDIPADHVLSSLLKMTDTPGWIAFLVASYVLGHVVASLGAQLDPLYDARKAKHRDRALATMADITARKFEKRVGWESAPVPVLHVGSPSRLARLIDWIFLWHAWRGDTTKADDTKPAGNAGKRLINSYKLARLSLRARSPEIFAEMARLEADSKFFRSLVIVGAFGVVACIAQLAFDVVLLIEAPATWERSAWGLGYLLFVFIVLRVAFARFCELRLKATEVAFQGFLIICAPPDTAVDSAN